MNMEPLFAEMIHYYADDPHQIQHFIKVHSFAQRIGLAEGLDRETLDTLEAAAILHDIGIKPALEKYGSSNGKYQELEGPPIAQEMLDRLGFSPDRIQCICYLIGHHHTYDNIDGIDYQILVEADFLVNLHENDTSKEGVASILSKLFKTKAGTQLCRVMFGIFD